MALCRVTELDFARFHTSSKQTKTRIRSAAKEKHAMLTAPLISLNQNSGLLYENKHSKT